MNAFRIVTFKYVLACLLPLCLNAFSATNNHIESLPSFSTDDRENRVLTLDNGMTIIIISDAKAEQSSIAVSWPSGSFYESIKYPGLARLHQKMLISGSTNYTSDNGITRIITSHKGIDLSAVHGSFTNLAFSIDHAMYKGLIDRLVDSFNAPSFSAKLASTKIKGLHSDWYQKKSLPEELRLSLLSGFSDSEQVSHFTLGNLTTLKANDDLMNALTDYHERSLSPKSMKVIMVSPKPIDEMVATAKNKFGKLTLKNSDQENFFKDIDFDKMGGKHVFIHAPKQQFIISLPIKNIGDISSSKFDELLRKIVINDQKNSFTRWLNDNDFTTSLDMRLLRWPEGLGFIEFIFDLTATGQKNKKVITQEFFNFISLVKNAPSLQPYHKELSDILKLDSLAYKPLTGAEQVHLLATEAHLVPIADVLIASHLLTPFSQKSARQFINNINLDNAIIFDYVNDVKLPERHKYFTLPYAISGLSVPDSDAETANKTQFSLPTVNKYIPTDFVIKSAGDFKKPTLLTHIDGIETSYMSSHTPLFPMGSSTIYFNHSGVTDNFDLYLKNILYIEILKSRSETLKGHASHAINELYLSAISGLKITISGIPEKQQTILSDLFSLIKKPVEENELSDAVDLYKQKLNKRGASSPIEKAFLNFDALKKNHLTSHATIHKKLDSFTTEDLNEFSEDVVSLSNARLFTYGNYSEDDIKNLTTFLKGSPVFESKKLPADSTYQTTHSFALTFPTTYLINEHINDNNNAIFDCHIDPKESLISKASAIIFVMMVRTRESKKESLGIKDNKVLISYREIADYSAIGFSLAGSQGLIPLGKSIDLYKKEIFTDFERMNKYSFEELKKDIVSQIEQTVSNLEKDIDYHITNWIDKTPDEKSRISVIKTIETVKLQDVLDMYKRLFRESGGSRILIQELGEKSTNKDKHFRTIKDGVMLTKD